MSGELLSLRLAMANAVVKFLDDDTIRPMHPSAFKNYKEQAANIETALRGFTEYEAFVDRLLGGFVDFENEEICLVVVGGDFAFFDEKPTREELEELERSRLPDRINGVEVHPSGMLLMT